MNSNAKTRCTPWTKPSYSHLRLLNIPVGLLINFHVVLLKDGLRRMVNNYREDASDQEKLLTAKFAKKGREGREGAS